MLKEKAMQDHQQEIFRQYYEARIKQMEEALEKLNILEHAVEITAICRKIISTRQLLGTMKRPEINASSKILKRVQGYRINTGKILKRPGRA
jgi:uncharacterized protein YjgD (DUF1641 family)